MNDDEITVWVRRQWNVSLGAKYRLSDVGGWHWADYSGGVARRSPRPMVYAYVQCDGMLEGSFPTVVGTAGLEVANRMDCAINILFRATPRRSRCVG